MMIPRTKQADTTAPRRLPNVLLIASGLLHIDGVEPNFRHTGWAYSSPWWKSFRRRHLHDHAAAGI